MLAKIILFLFFAIPAVIFATAIGSVIYAYYRYYRYGDELPKFEPYHPDHSITTDPAYSHLSCNMFHTRNNN